MRGRVGTGRWLAGAPAAGLGVVVLGTLLGSSSLTQSGGRPAVTAAVQVTDNPTPVRAHSTPQIAANPRNGELVVVGSNPRGTEQTRTCNVYISVDDGRSWFRGGNPMAKPYTDCSIHGEYGPYATLAFGGDGVLYVAFVASDPRHANHGANPPRASRSGYRSDGDCDFRGVGPSPRTGGVAAAASRPATCMNVRLVSHPPRRTPRHVFLARSEDGGRTFETTTVFKGPEEPVEAPRRLAPTGINKGPMVAVDPADSSRVYVGWRQGDLREDQGKLKSLVAASSDGGRTFGEPVDLTGRRGGDFPSLAVDSEGTVHAVYWARTFGAGEGEQPVSPIYYLRSTDHGKTFGRRVKLDPGNQDASRPPLIAADPNSDSLYVTWSSHHETLNGGEDFQGDRDIFLRVSREGGASWSDRRTVNTEPDTKAAQYLPGIAIGPGGRVDIAWYADRGSDLPGSAFQDVVYATSRDHGRTFTAGVRVNDRMIDRSIGVWGNNILSRHNVGITSTDHGVYFAWQDTRAGNQLTQAEDIYTSKLAWDGDPRSDPVVPLASKLLWALLGAAGTLLAGGLVLLAAARRSGR